MTENWTRKARMTRREPTQNCFSPFDLLEIPPPPVQLHLAARRIAGDFSRWSR